MRQFSAICCGSLLAGIVCLVALSAHPKDDDNWLRVPILIRDAHCSGQPVRPAAWIRKHVTSANAILKRYHIELIPRVEPFQPDQCELTTRRDRHGMAKFVTTAQPTVLVVRRVQDLDVHSYNLMGVHWRYAGPNAQHRGRRWVLLTARAKPPVLAHELCHYFGLRHDKSGGNLMTPGPSDPSQRGQGAKPAPFKPILRPWQVKKLRNEIWNHLGKTSD